MPRYNTEPTIHCLTYFFTLGVVVKNCEPELYYILAEFFNNSLNESCFPDCCKVSFVVPVFKNVWGKVLIHTFLIILSVILLFMLMYYSRL